jgi:hypothetical protein
MKKKILLSFLLFVLITATGTWYYIFVYSANHHRSVADEKTIDITASQLVTEYQINEAASNAKYLNKALKIVGEVSEVKKDQEGKTTVTIKSNDAFANVFCTLQSSASSQPSIGSKIMLKGFCSGFLSDVVIKDAIVVTE